MTKLESALGDALFVTEVDFEKFKPSKKWMDTTHFHVDNEIHVMLGGNALIEIDGADVSIKEGDVCLLAPHSSHYPKQCSETLEKVDFSFNLLPVGSRAKRGASFSEYAYYGTVFKSVKKYFIVNDEELVSIVKRLLDEKYTSERAHIFTALLSVFYITLANRIEERSYGTTSGSVLSISKSESGIGQRKTVEEFFQKRYHENVSINDLAKALCLSVPQTHRIVKKVFDEGFKKTLMKQRIEHACMLIKQKSLTLSDIAERCGYTSYNGFLSAFKSHMGKTPKEYEKAIQ